MEIADLPLESASHAREHLRAVLVQGDALERYWALIAATSMGREADPLVPAVRQVLADHPGNLVATRAAEFPTIVVGEDARSILTRSLRHAGSLIEASLILNTAVMLEDHYAHPRLHIDLSWFAEAWRLQPVLAPRLDYMLSPGTR